MTKWYVAAHVNGEWLVLRWNPTSEVYEEYARTTQFGCKDIVKAMNA